MVMQIDIYGDGEDELAGDGDGELRHDQRSDTDVAHDLDGE